MTWSENDFSADRDGAVQYGPNEQPSYNENTMYPLGGAPTRGSTPVPSLKQPTTNDEEDAQMQQAIAMSRESANLDYQESGVLSGGKNTSTRFGPAVRSNYDPTQWAVTLPGQEIMPDLDPLDRIHHGGEPRCLRPLPSHQYLPNLLTILHSIPLARKSLLLPTKTRTDYGHDSEWWNGHTIRLPRIVSTVDLSSAEPATGEGEELVTEVQRLMALLDASTRSYGSVDSLLRLDAVNNMSSDIPRAALVDRVLHAWELSAKHVAPDLASDAEIFRSVMGTNDEDGVTTPYMRLMPLHLATDHGDRAVTFTEALNELLWDLDDPEEYDNYIEQPSEVLCIHVAREDQSVERAGLIVPPSFYIDQYLKDNVGETRALRKQISQTKQRLTNIEAAQFKLQSVNRSGISGRLESSLVLGHSIDHFSGQNERDLLDERASTGANTDVDLPAPPEVHEHIAERLNAVYASIKAKLECEYSLSFFAYQPIDED